jgi:hypothetical protein
MELQRCRICGERHRLGPCPQGKAAVRSLKGRPHEKVREESDVRNAAAPITEASVQRSVLDEDGDAERLPSVDAVGSKVEVRADGKIVTTRDRERYRAYQREYQRKRRASLKEKK